MEEFEDEYTYNEGKTIVGWCSYCKGVILRGEGYLVDDGCIYHAEETEEHYNCAKLLFGEDE